MNINYSNDVSNGMPWRKKCGADVVDELSVEPTGMEKKCLICCGKMMLFLSISLIHRSTSELIVARSSIITLRCAVAVEAQSFMA